LFPEIIESSSILAIIEFKERKEQVGVILYCPQNKICKNYYIIEEDIEDDKLFNRKKISSLAKNCLKTDMKIVVKLN
jgi:hypothetical protein